MLTPLKAHCTAQEGEWDLDKNNAKHSLQNYLNHNSLFKGENTGLGHEAKLFEDGKQSNGYVLIKEGSLKGFIQQQVAQHDEITALEAFLPSFQCKHKL